MPPSISCKSAEEPPGSVMFAAVLLIPAFQPNGTLVSIVSALASSGFRAIVVVDDGSGPETRATFDRLRSLPGVRVVRNAVNLGKGAALKNGMNYALVEFPEIAGVVTADSDGQHDPADIIGVARAFAATPAALVIGTREFPPGVPLRSRVGNLLTRRAMRILVGHTLSDTQSGLRAVPNELIEKLLAVPASGYEFELEMLIATRQLGVAVREVPIRTIYEPGNPTSHFRPLIDSMRIYFVLLRFSLISLTTAVIDNIVFFLLLHSTGVVPLSLAGARSLALIYNYTLVRTAVFHSREPHRVVLPRYFGLAAGYTGLSYVLMTFLAHYLKGGIVPAKMLAETFLFIANFALQRDFVFARTAPKRASGDPV